MRLSNITRDDRKNERGNAFLFILLGVVLFAALGFTVSRGLQSQTTNKLSDRQVGIIASDILNYAQQMQRATDRVRRNGISENDISFESAGANPNTACDEDTDPDYPRCLIFHPEGGAITWQSPPEGASNAGNDWIITGSTCIPNIGNGDAGCGADSDSSNEELLLVLEDIDVLLCEEINEKFDIASISVNSAAGSGHSSAFFTGSFADGNELNPGGTFETGCYEDASDLYHFYSVLIER